MADLLREMRSAIRRGKSPVPQTAAERKITAALNKPTQMEFIETPLDEVVRYLKKLYEIEIQIDRRALGEVGIDVHTPLTVNLKGVSLQSALRHILRDHSLTYVIRDEVLLITTPEEADEMMTIRAFDVADLVTSHDKAGRAHDGGEALQDAISARCLHACAGN